MTTIRFIEGISQLDFMACLNIKKLVKMRKKWCQGYLDCWIKRIKFGKLNRKRQPHQENW